MLPANALVPGSISMTMKASGIGGVCWYRLYDENLMRRSLGLKVPRQQQRSALLHKLILAPVYFLRDSYEYFSTRIYI